MLKLLNIFGYISLLSILYFIPRFIFLFDLFLQITNIVLILIFIIINFIFFRKKKYLGLRCLIIIVTFFILSLASYNMYMFVRGNIFKNEINQIYNENKNIILTSEELLNYNITYIPSKLIISKEEKNQGYIKFKNSDKYEDILYYIPLVISSSGTILNNYRIVYNSNTYYFEEKTISN